ncbi:ABC-type glycerol-3-phosphate transport system, substrate-binding protein [Anaerosporobacter mobilis DSM 15930]|jgi:ABC-type glycerol-3-phosphate transport system substrate-binding protein|uniref:ABC-type glycerol-3-phosphate transport system, substrate-binding protein n=1 Tax=Anaerosporobacter mobilis DSM 15930 TaxID=1120996 RepID=A0A1M7KAL4_9FIRM|nr:ABC transporter substrate-binding protein [Anaerosporobacter mobilis]SHM62332.1 ABC-type glycerol-3-phosphate transport system, substrate-binding protein [Anaerosporobacter mobilis DSM 15930]
MRLKKFVAIGTAVVLSLSFVGCSKNNNKNDKVNNTVSNQPSTEGTDDTATDTADTTKDDVLSYANIVLGESYTDISTTIKFYNNRTDMNLDDYNGKKWEEYVADFNKVYPNIKVEIDADTTYAESALLRLQSGDYGDILMIPEVSKSDLSKYFVSYGDLPTMEGQVRFASDMAYDGQVYGVAYMGTARGIVYNKAVFEQAGITTLPKTPEEFIAALQAIKDKTDATPLYTNYAAGWTMSAWDDYISGTATGDATYKNQKLLHMSNPFENKADGTGPYAVYKVLYDAVANGLTEDDFSTTDWEGSKGMLNNGQIGCMVLGSWAYPQMVAAGDHGDDIGYMSFPITVNGKQYASSGPDYRLGINVNSSEDNQKASMVFVKWLTEQSGFAYNENGIPVAANDNNFPELYSAFDGIELVSDDPAVAGEEDFLNLINADSDLMVSAGGNTKVQQIIEHAANKDMTFDEIMADWNAKWTSAQEGNDIEINQ